MESGNRTDNMERRIAPDGMTEDGKKESEAIDRRVEELMAPEEDDGNGRKKKKRKKRKEAGEKNTGLIKRIKGWSRRRKILTAAGVVVIVLLLSLIHIFHRIRGRGAGKASAPKG